MMERVTWSNLKKAERAKERAQMLSVFCKIVGAICEGMILFLIVSMISGVSDRVKEIDERMKDRPTSVPIDYAAVDDYVSRKIKNDASFPDRLQQMAIEELQIRLRKLEEEKALICD
jgi:hypothetical protein